MAARTKTKVSPKYKTNWAAYEEALRERGDITVWFDEEASFAWNAPPSGRPGGQRRYSDLAIVTSLTLRTVFHLPLRQTEGFIASLIVLMDLSLKTPDHTTLSRRNRDVEVPRLAGGARRPSPSRHRLDWPEDIWRRGVAGSTSTRPRASAAAGASCIWASMGMGVSSPPPSPTDTRTMRMLASRCSSKSRARSRSLPQMVPTIRDRCTRPWPHRVPADISIVIPPKKTATVGLASHATMVPTQ